MGLLSRLAGGLFSGDERGIDSIVVGGLLVVTTYCGLSAFDTVIKGRPFDHGTFAGGAAVILAAMAAAKAGRDRLAPNGTPSAQPQQPPSAQQ